MTLVSVRGTNVDLLHFLFGNVLALDNATLLLAAAIATVSLLVLAVIWRPLVLELRRHPRPARLAAPADRCIWRFWPWL